MSNETASALLGMLAGAFLSFMITASITIAKINEKEEFFIKEKEKSFWEGHLRGQNEAVNGRILYDTVKIQKSGKDSIYLEPGAKSPIFF